MKKGDLVKWYGGSNDLNGIVLKADGNILGSALVYFFDIKQATHAPRNRLEVIK